MKLMRKIIKFIKDYPTATFWFAVALIIFLITVGAILDPPGERTLLQQIGYEIGEIGRSIADGFTGK